MAATNFLQTYSFIVSVVYFSIYAFVFLIASIVCAYTVSQQMLKHEKYHRAKRNILQSVETNNTSTAKSVDSKRMSKLLYKPPITKNVKTPSVSNSNENDMKYEHEMIDSHYTLNLDELENGDEYEFDELEFMDLIHAQTLQCDDNKNGDDIFLKLLKHKNRKIYYPLQLYMSLMWRKKRCYMSLIPYLMDQATDFGAIYEYYYLWKYDDAINNLINCKWLFVSSICVILLHRIASSIIIYNLTKKWYYGLAQMFELMMIRAIFTNYKLSTDEPSNGQRYLALLESMFESTPQLLIAAVFIIRTAGILQNQSGGELIFISFLASLWCLTSKVVSDDRYTLKKEWRSIEYKWKKCNIKFECINWRYFIRAIGWRFGEITGRISLFSLLWISIGGVGMMFIIFLEVFAVVYIAFIFQNVDFLGNIMCFTIAHHASNHELTIKWLQRVEYYKLISPYLYMMLILIFAFSRFESWKVPEYQLRNKDTVKKSFGIGLFIYCLLINILNQFIYFYIMKKQDAFSGQDGKTRTINPLIIQKRYQEALELLEFGAKIENKHDEKTGYTIINYLCSINEIGAWLVIDDIVELIIKKSPELVNIPSVTIDAIKTFKKTPLQQAIENQNVFLVKTLCENGADVFKTDIHSADALNSNLLNKTALHLAWFTNHEISNIKSINDKSIKIKLCMIKQIAMLQPKLIASKDLIGNTFFHKTMFLNQDIAISVLKIFIKAGGLQCVYTQNQYKQTILHTACQKRKTSVKVIKFLVEQVKFHKYIDRKDTFNLTPRKYAENNKLESIISYFNTYRKPSPPSSNNMVPMEQEENENTLNT